MTQIKNITATLDETHLLFDSSYWDNQEIFTWNESLSMENEQLFELDERMLGANEKYIRNFTCYEQDSCIRYRKGGLVIAGSYCGFKEGYLKPGDRLHYKEADSDEIKQVNINELIIFATQHFPIDNCYSMHFAIYFRSIKTGVFYSISYDYAGLYQTYATTCDGYPDFYAKKTCLTEKDFLDATASEKYSLRLHNQRENKLETLFSLNDEDWT